MGDRWAVTGVVAGVAFVGGVAAAMARSDAPYPRPGADAATVRRYFGGNPGPARVSVAGQVVSAAAIARFGMCVAELAGRAGGSGRVAGQLGGRGGRNAGVLRVAALAGGGIAAVSLAVSAAHSAALTTGERDDAATVRLARRGFAAGGPVHTAAFGTLVGALGLAGLRTGRLPRPLAQAALVSAGLSLASPLSFAAENAAWFIPAGRFSGLVVSGIAGVRLAGG